MRVRRALVGLATVTAVVVGPAGGAGADAPDATGWWARTRAGATLSPVPVPSTVPEGGLYVAGDPIGPLGVSALRLALGSRTATEVVLELESVQGTPAVRACPTPNMWPDEQGGPIGSAPPAECDVAEVLGTEEDGRLRFAVAGLVREGMLNVVLTPVPGTVFQATFRPPGDGSVVVVEPAGPGGSEPAGAGGTPAPAPAPAPVAPLPPIPPAPIPATEVEPAVDPDEVAFEAPRRITEAASLRTESNRPQVVALVVLFDLALLYVWLLRRPVTPDAARFGIGRFAREREGAVPRL